MEVKLAQSVVLERGKGARALLIDGEPFPWHLSVESGTVIERDDDHFFPRVVLELLVNGDIEVIE